MSAPAKLVIDLAAGEPVCSYEPLEGDELAEHLARQDEPAPEAVQSFAELVAALDPAKAKAGDIVRLARRLGEPG